ncbi:MAG: PilN domain-containing protein [Actinomycetota bacterium]|nr:PilN domain-containing protein [Actinomycetota bacterium]
MRRINLLPPEERRRPAERLRGGVPAVLLIVGAVAIIAMVGMYLFFLMRLNGVEDEIAELDQQIAEQNQRLAELAPYRDLQARLEAKKPVADGIFRTRFPWDQFLQGLAFIIPETTALDTFTAEAAPIDIQAPVEQPLEPPGAITFTGIALPQYQNVADFVVQMNNLRYLANTQLNSAELDRATFAQPAISFEVASELVTVVGESGTEVRIDGGSLDEVADTAAEGRYQARAGYPRSERQ